MRPGEFYTWNRSLHVSVVDGALPTELLMERTLGLTYFDRSREFDSIEWKLDNRDGLLTRPEYIAAGMTVRLKIGYINGAFPWKVFVINRFQGGLGVYGHKNPAVGSNESEITFYGRNRNAPGGRGARPWRRTAQPPPKKPRKSFPATADITSQELLLDSKDKPRIVKAETTAEAVLRIAERNGFEEAFTCIQPTDDHIEEVRLKEGQSDGQFLAELAGRFHWVFKISDQTLFWHSPNWSGAKRIVADKLHYGVSGDILTLTVDCDFRLPVPGRTKGVGYDWRNRSILIADFDRSKAEGQANIATGFVGGLLNDPGRYQTLTRYDTFPVLANGLPQANSKTIQQFINKHYRAFILVVKCVGNPKLLANRLVDIAGIGSPFADGRWLIDEARHDVSSSTYETEVKLKPPPKQQAAGRVVIGRAQDAKRDKDEGITRVGVLAIQQAAAPPDLRRR